MAIEGGATWIVVRGNGIADDLLRPALAETADVCREAGAILTIEGHTEMARDAGIHGVLLPKDGPAAAQVRELFGPEAIIGVEAPDCSEAIALERADIDYLALLPLPGTPQSIAAARTAGATIPFVAMGDIGIEQCRELLMQGYSGICTGRSIFEAEDPVQKVRQYLDAMGG